MSEPYLGQIIMFAGNFAIRGWAFCHGQLLPIAQNTALFSILGTTYGGNGQTTFALPDIRGRVPIGAQEGHGLSHVDLGEAGGHEYVTPSPGRGQGQTSEETTSVETTIKISVNGVPLTDGNYGATRKENTSAPPNYGNQIDVRQPFLGLSFLIALEGIFPSRN